MRPSYDAFVFDQIRTIGRAWYDANPGASTEPEFMFEKIGEMSWRALVDEKSLHQILMEIGVNPGDYITVTPPGGVGGSANQVGRLETGTEPFFRVQGQPWRYTACDLFAAPMLHAAGENIDPMLDWAIQTGFVVIRCFFGLYYIAQQMGRPSFLATPDQTRAFFDKTTSRGLRVEWTVGDLQILKPDLGSQRAWYAAQGDVLNNYELAMAETGNESFKNGVDVGAIGRWTNVPLTSGVYNPPFQPRFNYGVTHTPRDGEWPRKAKELFDLYQGFDPDNPGGIRMPWVSDEPMGADEVMKDGSRSNVPNDFFDDGACAALMGAGGTFHSTDLVYARVPGPIQQECARMYVAGAKSFDADVAGGQYTRGLLSDCPLEHDDNLALRTFVRIRGNRADALVIRPKTSDRVARNGWRIVSISGPNNRVVRLER